MGIGSPELRTIRAACVAVGCCVRRVQRVRAIANRDSSGPLHALLWTPHRRSPQPSTGKACMSWSRRRWRAGYLPGAAIVVPSFDLPLVSGTTTTKETP
jgi:hypothetical protein